MATDFEKLDIVLAARDREFQRTMDRAIRRLDKFERGSKKKLSRTSRHFDMMGAAARRLLPALAALASVNAVRGMVADLDNIGKTADRLGLTTDALQELRAAAESAGVSQNTLDMAMQRFGRRVAEARQGTGEARGVLAELGIELTDAAGNARDIEDVLADVADEMSVMADQTDRNRVAMKLFDSEGVAMVNLLREGADSMARMREEARQMGVVIDEDLIRKAEESQSQLDLMGRVIKAELSSAFVELAPLITHVVGNLTDFVTWLAQSAKAVRAFLDPQTELETATSNVVLAMADEIRQSRVLDATLQRGGVMSAEMAKQKLAQARAHYETAQAAIAEARAVALQSGEYEDLSARIEDAQAQVRATGFPARDAAVPARADAFEGAQRRLAELLVERQRLLDTDEEMVEQLERTERQIDMLTEALANASDGYVQLGGAMEAPVELGDRLEASAGRAGRALDRVPDAVDDVRDATEGAARAAEQMDRTFGSALARIVMQGGQANQVISQLLSRLGERALTNAATGLSSHLGLGALFSGLGFADGGYTGPGPRRQPAGIVHRREFVMDADATRRIGVGTLRAMQDGAMPVVPAPAPQRVMLELRVPEGVTVEEVQGISTQVALSVVQTSAREQKRSYGAVRQAYLKRGVVP